MNEICKHCRLWKLFGQKCWSYWKGKKECSQNESLEEYTELEEVCKDEK